MARARLKRATGDLLSEVLDSPVEHGFFVSVDHLLVMERRRREGKLPAMSRDTREMWSEIFAAFDAYRQARPEATLTDAAIHVVARGRASRFYISRRNARKILFQNKIII